jgi:sugar/nucleoside kinase (ribokinase family)
VVSIAVIGNVNVDLLAWPVAEVPPAGTERPIDRIDLRVGGAAAVTAAALARLGRDPLVAGSVGRDAFGRVALDDLRRYGVDTSNVAELDHAPTGVSVAFEAPRRERSFVIALGTLAAFDGSGVPESALAADLVLVCGYFNLPALRREPARRLLASARERGARTLLDTGWDHEGWPPATVEEVRGLLPLVDIFVPNEAEAGHVSGERDPAVAARALAARSGGWAVVKLGADGALAASADGRADRVASPPVGVVDTTGAGDAFNAGLMDAMADGVDPVDGLEHAVRVASTVVSRSSNDRYPSRDQLVGARG